MKKYMSTKNGRSAPKLNSLLDDAVTMFCPNWIAAFWTASRMAVMVSFAAPS